MSQKVVQRDAAKVMRNRTSYIIGWIMFVAAIVAFPIAVFDFGIEPGSLWTPIERVTAASIMFCVMSFSRLAINVKVTVTDGVVTAVNAITSWTFQVALIDRIESGRYPRVTLVTGEKFFLDGLEYSLAASFLKLHDKSTELDPKQLENVPDSDQMTPPTKSYPLLWYTIVFFVSLAYGLISARILSW